MNKIILLLSLMSLSSSLVAETVMSVDSGDSEYQWSAKDSDGVTDKVGYPYTIGLLDGLPAIGVYGTPYIMRSRIALFELSEQSVTELPEVVRNQVQGKKLDMHIAVYGQLQNGSGERTNNLIFHPWVAKIEGRDRFSVNVPMGIFCADGVRPAGSGSIAFDHLRPENVNPHDPLDLSPNNARFEIDLSKPVVTFWSVACYKDAATATFHVIINDPAVYDEYAQRKENIAWLAPKAPCV